MMKTTRAINPALAADLEHSEIQYWKKYYRPEAPLKSYASVIGGAMAFAVPSLPNLAMNRVIGLGLDQEITSVALESIVSFYTSLGVPRFFVQLSPHALKEETAQRLADHGFWHYNNWTKHYRAIHEKPIATDQKIDIKTLGAEQAAAFGRLICSCFDWNHPRLDHWINQSVGQEGYRHYAVYQDARMVAVAAMHVVGIYASMAFAATLPAYRGLGVQQALLSRRIADAKKLGCQYLVSETAEDRPERPVTSARNMQRMGFAIAYQRQNWIFESNS